jgi:hypothetical protein
MSYRNAKEHAHVSSGNFTLPEAGNQCTSLGPAPLPLQASNAHTCLIPSEIERLASEASVEERVRIMRDEMGPWLYEYMPAVSIGSAHSIAGVGPWVGDWPLIPGHMGLHNWEYVTRAR